jgi:hypothetical protein
MGGKGNRGHPQSLLRYEGKALGMLDNFLSKVDIELGPIEVPAPRLFNLQDRADRALNQGKCS